MRFNMESPQYLPASAYERPSFTPYRLSLRSVPLGELKGNPAAWEIVLKHMPMARMMAGQPEWLLDTMTLADFALFGGGLSPALEAAVDADLALLPPVEPA
jgi:hypothetical protein